MIETQQTLMSVTSSNYHQCAYCSKVFLNVSYLQAHINRRHASESNQGSNIKQATEFEKDLERIKERLRITESELVLERSARLGLMSSNTNTNNNNKDKSNDDSTVLLKKMEELKNIEIKRQKEEFKKTREMLKKEINELNDKNVKFEASIKDLQDKLGKESHVGWIKDDVDLEKDQVIKLKKEIESLNEIVSTNHQF